jgi:hypothetical protein
MRVKITRINVHAHITTSQFLISYYYDNILHRDNGPALEWCDGEKE